MLLQAPADCLAAELTVPGEGQLRGLVVVDADPAGTLPGSDQVRGGLEGLDLLVCLAHCHSKTTQTADWVLPLTYGWEQDDVQLLDAASLPRHLLRATPAVVPPAGDSRRTAEVLAPAAAARLDSAAPPRGAPAGASKTLLRADLLGTGIVEFAADEGADALSEPPFRIDRGDADRRRGGCRQTMAVSTSFLTRPHWLPCGHGSRGDRPSGCAAAGASMPPLMPFTATPLLTQGSPSTPTPSRKQGSKRAGTPGSPPATAGSRPG